MNSDSSIQPYKLVYTCNSNLAMKNQLRKDFELELNSPFNPILRVNISSLTSETFGEKYQKTGTPVVITGLLEKECDWNLDYLCEKLGNREFFVRHYGRDRYKQDKRYWKSIGSGIEVHSIPFNKYAEMLRNHQAKENNIFLGKGSLKNTPLADTHSLKIIGEKLSLEPATDFKMYMGPGGHITNLHYDILDGTLVQLHGTKKVVLFPPTQTNNLYPFPVYTHLRYGLKLRCCYSQVEIENPNLQLFPKFQQALPYKYEVILNQGEILYIPAYWWHEVTTLGNEMVCSVSRFWRVYPTSRAVFSWSRWRSALGNILAVPHLLMSLALAMFSSNRQQKLRKILYKL